MIIQAVAPHLHQVTVPGAVAAAAVHVLRVPGSPAVRVSALGVLPEPLEVDEAVTRGTGGTPGPCSVAICGLLACERVRAFVYGARNAVELGAGVGLGGLALAACLSVPVLLTDGDPDVMLTLRANARRCASACASVAHLPWSNGSYCGGDGAAEDMAPFDLVLACDCVSRQNHGAFVHTVLSLTRPREGRLLAVSHPRDDASWDAVCAVLSGQGRVSRIEGCGIDGVQFRVTLWTRDLPHV